MDGGRVAGGGGEKECLAYLCSMPSAAQAPCVFGPAPGGDATLGSDEGPDVVMKELGRQGGERLLTCLLYEMIAPIVIPPWLRPEYDYPWIDLTWKAPGRQES